MDTGDCRVAQRASVGIDEACVHDAMGVEGVAAWQSGGSVIWVATKAVNAHVSPLYLAVGVFTVAAL